ncbi:MAG: SCO family protein [Chitinophagales bacterium]|nr:SCO family protein [Chitinophagales bacterium]
MGKRSIPALIIAIFIPIVGYLILRGVGENAVVFPKKYFFDTVVTKEVDGKLTTDTFWHKSANFRLVNQLGDTVELYDIKGKPIVIDLFFTSCGSICPQLTKSMKKLQQSFAKGGNTREKIDSSVVQFISLSIDPERDSVPVLKHYADAYGVNPDNWWLLTGNRDSIYDYIFNELKIDKLEKVPISPEFPHTGRFVLLDKNYVVRGRLEQSYSGIAKDSASLSVLARDIGLLFLEKDKKEKSKVASAIIDLSWLWLIALLLISGFIWSFTQRKKKDDKNS